MKRRDERGRTPLATGPLTSAELASLGLTTVEQVREMGWEDAFARWVEAYPDRLNVNAAVGLLAACEGVRWQDLEARDRERARRVVAALRAELRRGH